MRRPIACLRAGLLSTLLLACQADPSGAEGTGCDLPLPVCPSPAPNYTRVVAPLLQRTCVVCHGPGGVQSGSPLDSLAGIKKHQADCLGRVAACSMPPPDGPQLSAADRLTLLQWLACDAPDT